MSVTIEHDQFYFWDNIGCISPHDDVGDAFERAGGYVEWFGHGEILVKGLSYNEACEIARLYQADFYGFSFSGEEPKPGCKNITPAKPRQLAK